MHSLLTSTIFLIVFVAGDYLSHGQMPPQEFPFNGQNPNNDMSMMFPASSSPSSPSSSNEMPSNRMNGRENSFPSFGQASSPQSSMPPFNDNDRSSMSDPFSNRMSSFDNNDRNQLQPWNQQQPQQQQQQPIRFNQPRPTASPSPGQVQAATTNSRCTSNPIMPTVTAQTKSTSIPDPKDHNSATPTSIGHITKSPGSSSSTRSETTTSTKTNLPTSTSLASGAFKSQPLILPVLMALFHLCI
ncbi:hypothetical protein BDF22DRAFT_743038 [Syncephalis plumigaleata]|nr:hypothetical protein BDF22DRAFT_743038 [Syncephalis plumigaleata]